MSGRTSLQRSCWPCFPTCLVISIVLVLVKDAFCFTTRIREGKERYLLCNILTLIRGDLEKFLIYIIDRKESLREGREQFLSFLVFIIRSYNSFN